MNFTISPPLGGGDGWGCMCVSWELGYTSRKWGGWYWELDWQQVTSWEKGL